MRSPTGKNYEHARGIELANEQRISELTQKIKDVKDRYYKKIEQIEKIRHEREIEIQVRRRELNENAERIKQIQYWLDDYVSDSVWPNYLVGDPKDANDPAAAKVHNEHMFEAMSPKEIAKYNAYQSELDFLLKQEPEIARFLTALINQKQESEHQIYKDRRLHEEQIEELGYQLHQLISNREKYLTIPDTPKETDYSASEDEVYDEDDIPFDYTEPILNADEDKKLIKLLQKLPPDTVAKVKGLLEENNDGIREAEEAANFVANWSEKNEREKVTDKRRHWMLEEQRQRLAVIPASKTIGLRKKLVNELAGKSEGEVRAYKHACMQLNRMEPVGDKFKLEFSKKKQQEIHAKEMIALRAGVDVSTQRILEVIVHDRLSEEGNVLRCELVGHFRMADIAIFIEEHTNGKMYVSTCLNADPDWPEVENNCDGVKPNRSQVINDNLDAIPTYIEYYKKIDEKLRNMPRTQAAE